MNKSTLLMLAPAFLAAACQDATSGDAEPQQQVASEAEASAMPARNIDYSEALRSASLKLLGTPPPLDEIMAVRDKNTYEAAIDRYLADPRLNKQIRSYFRDMLKMGGEVEFDNGNGQNVRVNLDFAPNFAAMVAVSDRPMTDLFTANTDTCPTFDEGSGVFTPGSCQLENGLAAAGVLTDQGAMAQFYSNMAFRRTRWIQETFDCARFPVEYAAAPVQIGTGQYVNPWPFESIGGSLNGGSIDFHDTSSVVCANCHGTMNHIAPLFANFDGAGRYQTSTQVRTPTPELPITARTDWLPEGQGFGWRVNKPVTDLASLGQAMASDSDVMRCQVARAWNWAMSKTDIVDDLTQVPRSTTASIETQFTASGYRFKPLLRAIFTHDDYVRF